MSRSLGFFAANFKDLYEHCKQWCLRKRIDSILNALSTTNVSTSSVGKLAPTDIFGRSTVWNFTDQETTQQAAEQLKKVMHDKRYPDCIDCSQRQLVASALPASGKYAVTPLWEMLGDSDANVRLAAAKALGRITESDAVEPLIQALRDDNAEIRRQATESLGGLKTSDKRVDTEPIVRALQDHDAFVRSGFY